MTPLSLLIFSLGACADDGPSEPAASRAALAAEALDVSALSAEEQAAIAACTGTTALERYQERQRVAREIIDARARNEMGAAPSVAAEETGSAEARYQALYDAIVEGPISPEERTLLEQELASLDVPPPTEADREADRGGVGEP